MGPDQFFMRIPPELFGEFFGRENFQRVSGPTDRSLPRSILFAGASNDCSATSLRRRPEIGRQEGVGRAQLRSAQDALEQVQAKLNA